MKNRPRISLYKFTLIIYILAFSGAFFNHVSDVLRFGIPAYDWSPPFFNYFWTSLTLIDAIVIYLMIKDVRLGVYLAMAVISIDVIANITWNEMSPSPKNYALFAQILFFGYVSGSFPFLIRSFKSKSSTPEVHP